MKKAIILSLLALTSIASQAQTLVTDTTRALFHSQVYTIYSPLPTATADKKSGMTTIEWPSTENNSWHENIGILNNAPIVKDSRHSVFKTNNFGEYVPMSICLANEGDNTVLHCYFHMKSDIVTNLWLGNTETAILDKETGVIYQAKSTVPEQCYNKVFGVKGKKGTVLDLQINFPKLPETAKDLAIYGVPNWFMRGQDYINNEKEIAEQREIYTYDESPDIHLAHKVKDADNYNKDNHESWAVYDDAHTIKPVKEKTMALWLTEDATYLAIATEHNWNREYYGPYKNIILLDNRGHQYKCKEVMGYPKDEIFWLDGHSGDYFAMVLVFEPLPLGLDTLNYIVPEGEPFNMWGANWSGEVIQNLDVKTLRKNKKLFDYKPRVVVK